MVASPATSAASTSGGGVGDMTVTASDKGLSTSPNVWRATTTWPAASGEASASDHAVLTATAAFPTTPPPMKTVTLAPPVPTPVMVVLPAMRGRSTYGAGGATNTATGVEETPVTPA